MSALTIIISILQVISGIALTAVVLFQSGKGNGLGALAGGAENFLSKGNAKTIDEKLAKMTKWIALVFAVLSLLLSIL